VIEGLSTARPLWVPGGILALAAVFVWLGQPLPLSLSGLRSAGPYFALTAAVGLAAHHQGLSHKVFIPIVNHQL